MWGYGIGVFLYDDAVKSISKSLSILSNGAAQANLSPVELCKSQTLIPSKEILISFNKLIFPIRNSYIQNYKQNTLLTKLRDKLLPLMMNGQVTIV